MKEGKLRGNFLDEGGEITSVISLVWLERYTGRQADDIFAYFCPLLGRKVCRRRCEEASNG